MVRFEWMQVILCSAALLMTLKSMFAARRSGRPVVLDVLIVAGLTGIVIGEVDLDKRIFGVKIIAPRFFVDEHVFLAYRVLAVSVVVGAPLAVGLYGLRKWRHLWVSGLDALRHPWGRVLLAAVLTFGATQTLERGLGHVAGFPRNLLEEGLELVAAMWFCLAAAARLVAGIAALPENGED
jgi:hypothetical protein